MECILDYLENTKKLPKPVAQVLGKTLCKYTDIAREFAQWINTKEYPSQNALSVHGYTAKAVHEKAPFLDEVGVYSFLVTARDNPQKAERYFSSGFPRK